MSSDEHFQPPCAQVPSQQPPPALLTSLGIKVRDFAFENTLPAIVPVPRVPRQVQPAPRTLKRSERDWDASSSQPLSGAVDTKRPRSLERTPTEPLQEPLVQHSRTLDRLVVRRVCSVIIPLPVSPHTRFSASPPTSPLTPLSHVASGLIQAPPAFPFVVHVDDTDMIPTPGPESQPIPALYALHCSAAASTRNASPALFESPSPNKELEVDPRVHKRRSRGMAGTALTPKRYQLRQRPTSSSTPMPLSRRLRR